ncbi:QcrA and Rieske domain-containing protein [Planctomonas psychrotolerans]|uniref:QcrA and Rieske domain-containing protein n=1 Tax=Planctomonas psychrotolerans TaxID=2528712 RepID=UPI0012384C12|nr:Rieske (2Fe-2S) protein [Planctomonas psychrotolerans]
MTDAHVFSRRTALSLGTAGTLGIGLAACAGPAAQPSGGSAAGGTASGTVVAPLADVPVGGSIAVDVDGAPYVVAQPTAGEVVAYTAVCTHQGCKVVPAEKVLDCPCHASQFDAFTGEVIQGPADQPLAELPVTVDGDTIVTA